MTTRSQVVKLVALIPKDPLRPHAQFGETLASRIDEFTAPDVAALQSITSNRHALAVHPILLFCCIAGGANDW